MEDLLSDSECLFTPVEEFPNTAPVNSQDIFADSVVEEDVVDNSWGWLQPNSFFNFESIVLTSSVYSFGKSAGCDVQITEPRLRNRLSLSVVSKKQFELSLQTDAATLTDCSMNGTFVNRELVGKGKTRKLYHGDTISITGRHCHMYTFLEPVSRLELLYDWMPPEMRIQFTVRARLGEGAFGQVNLVQSKCGELYAVKRLRKQTEHQQLLRNEVQILQRLQHPCVISMNTCFETNECLYIVMEYANGGDLGKLLDTVECLSEYECKSLLYQLTRALQYLHAQGIAHRDLKPVNILLQDTGDVCDRLVKVSDFGLSKVVCSGTELHTRCGTLLYSAPEVLLSQLPFAGAYTHKVDIWSLGVILFRCLSGKLPFYKDRGDGKELVEQIVRGDFSVSGAEWRDVPVTAVSLVCHMLTVKPCNRIHCQHILTHPWLQDSRMLQRVNQLMGEGEEVTYQDLTLLQTRGTKRTRADAELSLDL